MAFCRNCGSEVPKGTKFCSNCGTSVEIQAEALNPNDEQMKDIVANAEVFPRVSQMLEKQVEEPVSKIDKFGKFYGIGLLILTFIDLFTDPAFLTIVLSAAIIAGCIFCFGKKYKLKGFTIVALILAIFCLLCGFSQGMKIGLFKMPQSTKEVEATLETVPEVEISADEEIDVTVDDNPVIDEEVESEEEETVDTSEIIEEEVEQPVEAEVASEETETVDGVDPDLKAFLDSYEEFMDEYVAFMKKYMDDPSNAIAMLSEYTKIMEKYEDFADKIDKYDSDNMSKEDAKYYLEVVNRCNQKMLDLY